MIQQTKADTERYLLELKERTYKGKLEGPDAIRDYDMKEFHSVKFIPDGYKFLEWSEIFS